MELHKILLRLQFYTAAGSEIPQHANLVQLSKAIKLKLESLEAVPEHYYCVIILLQRWFVWFVLYTNLY